MWITFLRASVVLVGVWCTGAGLFIVIVEPPSKDGFILFGTVLLCVGVALLLSCASAWIAGRSPASPAVWDDLRAPMDVGIRRRRELSHLPRDLERLLVDAQRFRRQFFAGARVLRSDDVRCITDIQTDLRTLSPPAREHLRTAGLDPAHLTDGLVLAFNSPERRDKTPAWLRTLAEIDRLLYRLLKAGTARSQIYR